MRRWLKWTLIGSGTFLTLVLAIIGAIAYLLLRQRPPDKVEAISENWVIDHYSPWNPDGRQSKYLARRGARTNKEVSGKILAFGYVGDDCVIYSDYDQGLFGVCGEGAPVYITTTSEALDLEQDVIIVGKRQFAVSDIKRAAQLVSEEQPGGQWWVQRQAFPSDSQGGPYFILFHVESTRRRRLPGEVLAYRYIGRDCMLYAEHPMVRLLLDPAILGNGQYPVAAACGKRYETHLGTVERPSDIVIGDAVLVNGRSMRVSEIRQRALSQREWYP